MKIPTNLLYSKEDEWVRVEGDECVIGISDYAQDALGDIVYIELPSIGASFQAEEVCGSLESVKAVAEIFIPVSGVVTAVNEALTDTPELLNEDPYGEAWILRLRLSNPSELSQLMNAETYHVYLQQHK